MKYCLFFFFIFLIMCQYEHHKLFRKVHYIVVRFCFYFKQRFNLLGCNICFYSAVMTIKDNVFCLYFYLTQGHYIPKCMYFLFSVTIKLEMLRVVIYRMLIAHN